MNTLDKLHFIENTADIYNIHYCKAGVGITFYESDQDKGDTKESWRQALTTYDYYPTFEDCIDAEYARLGGK